MPRRHNGRYRPWLTDEQLYDLSVFPFVARGTPLTPRNKQVVRMVLISPSMQVAAELLDVSPATVKRNLSEARRRQCVDTNLQLIWKLAVERTL